jgi:hypothetical protein
MFLVQLVYASKTNSLDEDMIKLILEAAQKKNKKNDITGILHFNSKFFLQCLEGGREVVSQTYREILNDQRHHSALLLMYKRIETRDFSQWNMTYVGEGKLNEKEFLKHSPTHDFDPYKLSGNSALNLLKSLSETQS